MIEAPILANIGIGTQGIVNGCVYEPSLKFGVIGRFGNNEKAIKATALDLATFKSEGIDLDPIGMFRLKAAKASFRDKLTDQLKEESTLISPDFNNEAIAVWTDAGEYGYGTKEDYQRIVSRAHILAQTEDSASMFWISPGDESAKTPTPHRAYLWIKKGDDVTAYSYSLAGNRDTLVKMMHGLGYRNKAKESLEDQTIFQKDSAFSHHDIYQTFTSSLTAHESQTYREFLDKFKKETEAPDSIREEKLRRYQETYEAKLRVNYAKDITKALETAVFGIVAMAQMAGSQAASTADRKEEAKTENVSYKKTEVVKQQTEGIPPIIVPGLIKLIRIIADFPKENPAVKLSDTVVSSDSQEAMLVWVEMMSEVWESYFKEEPGKNLSVISASQRIEKDEALRTCAREIFSPSPKQLWRVGDKTFGDSSAVLAYSAEVASATKAGHPRTSLAADKEYFGQVPSSPPADSESFFPPADLPKWEEEIINLGKSILKANSSGRLEDTNQQQETVWKEKSVPKSIDRLVLLLAVYFAWETKKELKQMVSILIDTKLLELFPETRTILARIEKSGLFELLPLVPFQPKIIYGLYPSYSGLQPEGAAKRIRGVYAGTTSSCFSINGGRRKKTPKKLPNVGLIYCKLAGLIYQYQPLVIKA